MAWITPITNWIASNILTKDDMNRIEGNTLDLYTNKEDKSVVATLLSTVMPKSGGTFTGKTIAQSNTEYTVKQMRNIILSPSDAVLANMADGDIWIKYV